MVGPGQGLLDILVPPLGPVPHPPVVQQVLLQLGEAWPQVADLHADRVAVQVVLRLGRLGVRPGVGLPLEDVVGGAVDQDQFDAGGVQRVRDRLVLRGRLGDRRDHRERRGLLREAVELGREGLQRHRQPAVAQLGEQRLQVLAELQVDDLGLFLPQPPQHGERRGRRVVADREDLQRLGEGVADVVDEPGEDLRQRGRPAAERLRGAEELLPQ